MAGDLGDFRISKKVKEKLDNKALLKKELAAGKSAQEIMEFTDESMAKFYAGAYHLFENKRYYDAANAFLFLVTLNPYNHDYWVGLGMTMQMCADFETAINAYEMAIICNLESPVPYFYLAKCLFAIHDRPSALEALNLALEYASEHPEYVDLKKQALAAKTILMRD